MTPRGAMVTLGQVRDWVARCPRVALGHWPTPLVPLRSTSRRLGIDLWMKRDDCSGLAAGGNKARKLEFVLGEALRQGAHTVVTAGPVTSNHTMMTAAACRRLGLEAHVVLGGTRLSLASGNLLLALCGIACRVVTIAVARRDALERFGTLHPRVLGEQAWTHFGLPGSPSPSTTCDWVLGYGEAGYAVPSANADAALRRLAHDDSYLLDPVYTARAFAGLERDVTQGTIPAGARVLFIHTGGLTTTPLADRRKDTST